jgi:DNA end-binding protein Ku
MRTIVNGIVNFGMVAIPVAVCGVKTDKHKPSFSTLHSECGHRISLLTKCNSCEKELFADDHDLVKGYEVTKDQFVVFTQEELDTVASDRDKTIDLAKFVKANEITPDRVEKMYWLAPPENPTLAEKYGLLYQSLAETKRVGIGVQSLWGRETPCAVVPVSAQGRGLQLWVLHLAEDMLPLDFEVPVPGREEKKLAKQVIEAQTGDFNPVEDLVTQDRARINALIAARVDNEELPVFGEPDKQQDTVDLMGALRESVDAIEKKKVVAKK